MYYGFYDRLLQIYSETCIHVIFIISFSLTIIIYVECSSFVQCKQYITYYYY